jgi:cytochrome c peroxidase
MKSSMAHLCVSGAGVAAVLAIPLATAVEEDDVTLLKRAQELFQPMPKDMATPESPITKERVNLGQQLFFDPRLTVDSNMSCASCHQPALYGTDALPTSIGVKQRLHPRNAPTNLNSALNIIHWRGDRESVEDQVIKALTSPITSGQPDPKALEDRLGRIPGYAPLFKAAFADDANPVTAQNIAKAIGAYERTLVTPSAFDAYLNDKSDALSPKARTGLQKFISNGMIPDGAQPIDGKTNQDAKVTFNQPGVYVITCKIHTLMGMMCVVVVGDPVNIDKIDPSALPAKAKTKILTLLNQARDSKATCDKQSWPDAAWSRDF